MTKGYKIASLVVLAGMVGGCGANAESADEPEIVTIVHERGPEGEEEYFIDTEAYEKYGEIVRIDEPGGDAASTDIGQTQQPVVLGTGYGGPVDDTQDFCGPGNGTWVRNCILPRSKTFLWSWNTSWNDEYKTAFDDAYVVANNTAWTVRPFVTGENPNLIFYSSTLAKAYAITVITAESTSGRVNGKKVYRHTTKPVEVHIDKTRIGRDLSSSATTRHRQIQHVLCHEIGHAMGLPHNPDGEGGSTCMQATGLTTVRNYSTKELTRLDIFRPGDWSDTTLITVQ